MPLQTVELGYGKANLRDTLATYAALKVEEPFNRVTAINSGNRQPGGVTHAVGNHTAFGYLINANIAHENGTILLLQASWKRGGVGIRDGAIFLRLRAGAPLYRIQAKVPTGAENVHGDRFTVFSGYADIMNEAELALAGLKVNRRYLDNYMSTEELEECYTVVQVAAETTRKPVISAIATPTGLELKEVVQAPMRRLRLRR